MPEKLKVSYFRHYNLFTIYQICVLAQARSALYTFWKISSCGVPFLEPVGTVLETTLALEDGRTGDNIGGGSRPVQLRMNVSKMLLANECWPNSPGT